MKGLIKIILAGTATWTAAVFSYNAIFQWAQWPWAWGSEGEILLLSLLPPLVMLFGFILFKWAMGDTFMVWLAENKTKIGSVLLFALLLSATHNASIAASSAEHASHMASEAYDMALSASDSANEAASEASQANLSCSYR